VQEANARARLNDFKDAYENGGRLWSVHMGKVEGVSLHIPGLMDANGMYKQSDWGGVDNWYIGARGALPAHPPRVYVSTFDHYMQRNCGNVGYCTKIYPYGVMIQIDLSAPLCVITSATKRMLDDRACAPLRVISRNMIPGLTARNICSTIGVFLANAYALTAFH
jgi:hypothetical protein